MPKKYKFSLESVLHYREMVEDQKEKEFAFAVQALQREQAAHENIKQQIAQAFESLKKCEQGEHSSEQFFAYKRYIQSLEMRKRHQLKLIDKAQMKVNQKRQELIEATRDKKVLEHLDTVRREQYFAELEMQENKFIDEIAITRFSYTNQNGQGGI